MFLKNGEVFWVLFIVFKPCANGSSRWGHEQPKSETGKLRSGMLWLTQATHSLSWDENFVWWPLSSGMHCLPDQWSHLCNTPGEHLTSVIKDVGISKAITFAVSVSWGCCIKAILSTPLAISCLCKIFASVCFGSCLGSLEHLITWMPIQLTGDNRGCSLTTWAGQELIP